MRLVPARSADSSALLALREAAAVWLAERGIRQWQPGQVSLRHVQDQVADGQWHAVRNSSAVIGALRLLWDDEQMWGPQPSDAAYVHGLVIDRRYAGTGLGRPMLAWAMQQAAEAARTWLRLDCGEDNAELRGYYEQQGFSVVGRRDFAMHGYAVVLLQ